MLCFLRRTGTGAGGRPEILYAERQPGRLTDRRDVATTFDLRPELRPGQWNPRPSVAVTPELPVFDGETVDLTDGWEFIPVGSDGHAASFWAGGWVCYRCGSELRGGLEDGPADPCRCTAGCRPKGGGPE